MKEYKRNSSEYIYTIDKSIFSKKAINSEKNLQNFKESLLKKKNLKKNCVKKYLKIFLWSFWNKKCSKNKIQIGLMVYFLFFYDY